MTANKQHLSLIFTLYFVWLCPVLADTQARNQVAFYIQEYGQLQPDSSPEIRKTFEIFDKVRNVADTNNQRLPKLVVINSHTEPWAIALPDGHIVLSQRAVKLCYRQRRDAEACLAFILGHELAHLANNDFWHQEVYGFLKNHNESQQVAKFLQRHSSVKAKEIAADDTGFVYAALAGFSVFNLFSEQTEQDNFFEQWVQQGNSQVTDTHGSAAQRAILIQQRLKEIQKKLVFFDFGVRLSQFDYCDDAVYFLREFLTVFPGREVMNNLGYCYLQMARKEMQAERAFLYWMPLLLDIETRANVTSRAIQTGSKSLKQLAGGNANGYLQQAIEYLQRAAQADAQYLPTHLNLAVAYLYLGKPLQARAILGIALQTHSENKQLLMLDALAIYEQSEAGLDLWPAAVSKLEKLASQSGVPLTVHYNLAQLLAMRPRLPQARQLWNQLANDNNELPFPIKAIVCREQTLFSASACLGASRKADAIPSSSWQWPIPQSGFVRVDKDFRHKYLAGWSFISFDWLQNSLRGNIYRSPDGKTEVLELDHFVQMQVIKQPLPLDLNRLKQQCSSVLRQHPTVQGVIWSCRQWAVLAMDGMVQEAWLIAR